MAETARQKSDHLGQRQLFWTRVGAIGSWVGALATVISVAGGTLYLTNAVQKALDRANTVILTPRDNDRVPQRSIVTGHSGLQGYKQYLAIIDAPEGKVYIQDGPIPVGANGIWSQAVSFGEPDRNCGVQFLVLFFASHETVSPGKRDSLAALPSDAIVSPTVVVTRSGPCPNGVTVSPP